MKFLRLVATAVVIRIWHYSVASPFLRVFGWQRLSVCDLDSSQFEFQELDGKSAGLSVDYAPFGSSLPTCSQRVEFPVRKWDLESSKICYNSKFPSVEANNRLWVTPRFESGPHSYSPSPNPGAGSRIRSQSNDIVLRRAPMVIRSFSEAVYCGTRAPRNWGHWLMNFLPGVMLAAEYFTSKSCPPLIVPPEYREGESRQKLFDLMWGQRPVAVIDLETTFEVKNLHWFEQPVLDSPRPIEKFRQTPKTVNVSILSRFRGRILDFSGIDASHDVPTRKIFLARESGSSRPYDYERVHEIASSFGFEVVYLNRLGIIDQVRLIYAAEKIVAPDGSALASLLFTHPSARATVLTRVDDTEDWFAFGAAIAGSSAQAIRHSGFSGKPWGIDPTLLIAALSEG